MCVVFFFFPLLNMGREGGMQRSCHKPAMGKPPHVKSWQRSVPSDALFPPSKSPGPTPHIQTWRLFAFSPAPSHHPPPSRSPSPPPPGTVSRAGFGWTTDGGQDADEPPETQRFAHCAPKGWDHHHRARTSKNARLQSVYLSPFP